MKKLGLLLACILLLGLMGCGPSAEPVDIQSADDLAGKTIGVQLGTTGDIYASDIEGANVQQFSKALDATLALKDGKIDAVLIDMEVAQNLVASTDGLKILSGEFFEPEDYAVAVKKGNTELLGLINTVLAEIKADGTYDRLIEGFIETPESERDEYISGDQVGTEGTLIMGTNAEFPPFEYMIGNDQIVGFDIEIAKLIAKKVNMTLEVQHMEFDALIAAVASGKVDMVLAGMTVLPDRLENADFSDTYFTSNQVIIVVDK
ncbi:MAG TPA: transporter substrate-binding domain-containing protein [Clostridiales bacterium]|jgi:ABC-type amino acid transport substrate-binding protein|nr:transporter substrate-binding domain-containing protein [Clostridiales bacterium]